VAPSGFNSCNLNKKLGCGKVCRAQDNARKFPKLIDGPVLKGRLGIKLRISCVLQKVELKFFLNSFNLKDKSNS